LVLHLVIKQVLGAATYHITEYYPLIGAQYPVRWGQQSNTQFTRPFPSCGSGLARETISYMLLSRSWPCSWPHILRKGWSRYTFFNILSGQGVVKHLMNEMQHSHTVKSLFAMFSSQVIKQQAAKAVTTAYKGVTTPCSDVHV